jgi:hypothetical protein
LDKGTIEARAQLTLGDATSVVVRQTPRHILLADDRGRLLVFDPARGELLRDLRIR